jgi:hypothetical protein
MCVFRWFMNWAVTLFVWLISHQPAVLFSHNKPVTSNQPAVLFSRNKSAPAISHRPNEQAECYWAIGFVELVGSLKNQV